MNNIWYTLIALAGLLFTGGIATIAWHAFVDWRENRRWPQQEDEWQTETGSMFAIREDEPRKVSDLGSFFEPEQPAADPWTDIETWTTTQLQEAQDQLDVIRLWAQAGFDEIPKPAPVVEDEALPALLFDGLTAEYKQINPHVAGNTTSWVRLSKEDDEAIRDPYQTWNGFGTDTPAIEPRRTRRTVVPAQRDGSGS